MPWAPLAILHEAGIAAWQPTWVCMGCAQSEQLGDLLIPAEAGSPCDRCGSILQWEYDRVNGTEAFGCPQRCARPAPVPAAQPLARTPDPDEPPPNPHQPEPPKLHPARSHHADTRFPEAHVELQSRGAWYDQGPPERDVQSPTNSWLYVPLLHGALGALSDRAIAMWRAEARAAPHWEEARRALAVSAPVPAAALTEALIAAASHRSEGLHQLALAEAAVLPPSTLVHLGWVVRHIARPHGYISAAGQEVCLMLYGGSELASRLDRLSAEFRRASAPPAPAEPVRRLTLTYGELSAAEAEAHPIPEINVEQLSPTEAAPTALDQAAALPAAERADSQAETDGAAVGNEAPPVGSPPPAWPRAALAWLGTIDLVEEFRSQLPTIRSVPRFLTAGVRRCLSRCLNDLQVAYRRRDEPAREAAWKLFLLAPRLLLARCRDTGPVGRAALLRRVELFESGAREQLLREARAGAPTASQRNMPRTDAAVLEEACERVRQGQLTRARQTLTAAALAPGNDETFHALSDPSRRPPHRRREIPAEVLTHEPAEAIALSVQKVAESLKSAKRGSAPGLSGATVDHYKLFLDDPAALELLAFAVNCFARADLPPGIIDALALSRLTALRKPGGGGAGHSHWRCIPQTGVTGARTSFCRRVR